MESARGGETPPEQLSFFNYMYIRYLFETQVSQYPYAELLSTFRAKVTRRILCLAFVKYLRRQQLHLHSERNCSF